MLGVISQVIMKYVTKWKEFLETLYAEKNVPNQHDKLQSAQNYSDDDTIAQETTQELPANEEWMLLSDLTPRSFDTTDQPQQIVDLHHNCQSDGLKYQESQISIKNKQNCWCCCPS